MVFALLKKKLQQHRHFLTSYNFFAFLQIKFYHHVCQQEKGMASQ